jgi:uncharacterized protein (TIGR03118 family)
MQRWLIVLGLLGFLALTSTPTVAAPIGFVVTNLASDQPGVAKSTDPDLSNAWGITSTATSPFWLGANGSGKSVLYNGAGVKQPLVVTIPGDGTVTGVAATGGGGAFNGNAFLFVSEDGTISGWRNALGTVAEVLATANPANSYKGLTVGTVGGNTYAYATNFLTGTIDVVKGTPGAPNLGSFLDPNLPAGYAPFNVENIGGILYVTYAVRDASGDDMAGLGNGIVDRFDLSGNFLGRLITGGTLNSPWGLALAPAGFGDIGANLLVGNFGDGLIHAFNPTTGAPVETLMDPNGNPIAIDGLWGLRFGIGGANGTPSTLYFTAGPDQESHGLFGDITAVPEPGTWWLLTSALCAIGPRVRRLKRGG